MYKFHYLNVEIEEADKELIHPVGRGGGSGRSIVTSLQ